MCFPARLKSSLLLYYPIFSLCKSILYTAIKTLSSLSFLPLFLLKSEKIEFFKLVTCQCYIQTANPVCGSLPELVSSLPQTATGWEITSASSHRTLVCAPKISLALFSHWCSSPGNAKGVAHLLCWVGAFQCFSLLCRSGRALCS